MNFRLRAVLISNGVISEDIVDLTRVKENVSPVPSNYKVSQSTQTEWSEQQSPNSNIIQPPIINNAFSQFKIKEEPRSLSPLKEESHDTGDFGGVFSDNSDDLSLITLKKKKKSKKELNGVKKKAQKKKKLKDWINGLPENTNLSIENNDMKSDVKEEVDQKPEIDVTVDVKVVKTEPGEVEVFNCCICFLQCYTKADILQHYR